MKAWMIIRAVIMFIDIIVKFLTAIPKLDVPIVLDESHDDPAIRKRER